MKYELDTGLSSVRESIAEIADNFAAMKAELQRTKVDAIAHAPKTLRKVTE